MSIYPSPFYEVILKSTVAYAHSYIIRICRQRQPYARCVASFNSNIKRHRIVTFIPMEWRALQITWRSDHDLAATINPCLVNEINAFCMVLFKCLRNQKASNANTYCSRRCETSKAISYQYQLSL